jgi:hypothetical protein
MAMRTYTSNWEHTSTAFGAGQGCNFKIRVIGEASLAADLHEEAFRLSRIIDHKCLEKDFAFFRDHAPTLENVARFLFIRNKDEKALAEITAVEIDGNANLRARADSNGTQIIYSFTSRDLRRVFDVNVTVAGHISPVNGMIIPQSVLEETLRQNFQADSLENSFSALKVTLLPRKLKSLIVRDALENTVVSHFETNDTMLAHSPHLHP